MNHRELSPAARGAALVAAALLAIAPAQGQAPSSTPGRAPGPGQSAQTTPMSRRRPAAAWSRRRGAASCSRRLRPAWPRSPRPAWLGGRVPNPNNNLLDMVLSV